MSSMRDSAHPTGPCPAGVCGPARPAAGRRVARLALAAALGLATLVAACGGGTSQVSVFKPERIIVLGDENSVIVDKNNDADGWHYTINDRSSTTAGKCKALPTFSQAVLNLYGFVAKECNPDGATPKAFILAQVDAKVDDPTTGVTQQVAQVSGGLNRGDLVTLMIGANDMIALYEDARDGRRSNADAVAEAERRGALLAGAVNAILATGARALIFTIPDMGLSPYAVAQNTANPGAAALLSTMSYQFNAYLRTRIDATAYDGRNYGLVLADDVISAMARFPSGYLSSPAVANAAACTTASALDCTTTTLVDGAGTVTHLWADDRHLGPQAHNYIGSQAQTRAIDNPF